MKFSDSRLASALTPVRVAALLFLIVVGLVAVAAPVIAPYDPTTQDIPNKFLPVFSQGHLFGTDELGRDVLARLIFGARVEFFVATSATLIAILLGVSLGLLGGYFAGWVETVTMRGVEVILAFPPIVLALLVVTIYGPGQGSLIGVMGVLFAPVFARLAYGQTMSLRHVEYVEAARVFNASSPSIMGRTILPNVSGPLVAQFPVTLAGAILLGSGLSYLGLGIPPPAPSWGGMVASGQRFMATEPALLIVPSLAVVLTVLAFGLVGDVLRDWLNPKQIRGGK